jgi:hypothetical protein
MELRLVTTCIIRGLYMKCIQTVEVATSSPTVRELRDKCGSSATAAQKALSISSSHCWPISEYLEGEFAPKWILSQRQIKDTSTEFVSVRRLPFGDPNTVDDSSNHQKTNNAHF